MATGVEQSLPSRNVPEATLCRFGKDLFGSMLGGGQGLAEVATYFEQRAEDG